MSYEIVKSIKIENGIVFVKGASNNVWPRDYHFWECPHLTKILTEKGQRALDLEILKAYESGNFQPGTKNKYSAAIKRLHRIPEYHKFNWRGNWEEYEKNMTEKLAEFEDLLLRAFTVKDKKIPCVISKEYRNGEKIYLRKKTRRSISWCRQLINSEIPREAKIFSCVEDAQEVVECSRYYGCNSDELKIVLLSNNSNFNLENN